MQFIYECSLTVHLYKSKNLSHIQHICCVPFLHSNPYFFLYLQFGTHYLFKVNNAFVLSYIPRGLRTILRFMIKVSKKHSCMPYFNGSFHDIVSHRHMPNTIRSLKNQGRTKKQLNLPKNNKLLLGSYSLNNDTRG